MAAPLAKLVQTLEQRPRATPEAVTLQRSRHGLVGRKLELGLDAVLAEEGAPPLEVVENGAN